jgi:xanthine dehydrogenase small subunit
MSLWADYQNRSGPPDRAEAVSVLSGNLCRCTGYRPILDAAVAAWDYPPVKLDRRPAAEALQSLAALPALSYQHGGQTWDAPRTLDDLADLADRKPGARIVAGATDVGLWVTKGLRDLGPLLSVGAVDELKEIRTEAGLWIGAGASLNDAFAALVGIFPELTDLADRFASPPVRNAGTLGGNVANGSPIGDSMPVLLALGASLVLRKGEVTRELALEDFYLGYRKTARQPGEIVVAVRVPPRVPDLAFRVWKVSKRRAQDISAVCAAFSLVIDAQGTVTQARLAFGGVAAIPARAPRAEGCLVGRPFDQTALTAAREALGRDFSPMTDGRATADYRRVVAQNLLTKLQAEVSAGARP